MYESSCSYAGALELKRSALKEEPWPTTEWPPYRLHQSTFEQLKQSVEKAKAALQDRSGLLGTATAFGDFYGGQLGQDATGTALGFGRTRNEDMLGTMDKGKSIGSDKLSGSLSKGYSTPTLSDTLRATKCSDLTMANKDYYERWLKIKEQMKVAMAEDTRIQELAINEIGIKPQATAVEIVSRVYSKYCGLYNKLCDCYDQMEQVQRRPYIKNIIDSITCRLMELKSMLEEIEAFEFTYPDNALQQMLIVPQDIEVLCPFFYPFEIRTKEAQYIIDQIFAGNRLGDPEPTPSELERREEQRLEEERVKQEEKEAEIKRKLAMGEDIIESVESVILSLKELEELRAQQEYEENIRNIQRMERSQVVIRAKTHKAHKDVDLYLELAGLKKPPAKEEIRKRAAALIQMMYRKFMELKRQHYRDTKLKQKLGMVLSAWKPPSAKEQLERVKEARREFRRKYYEQWLEKKFVEKARVLRLREGDIMEDISDEIRYWWRDWYTRVRVFDEYPWPEEGGTIVVVRGETFTVDEYVDWVTEEQKRLKAEASNPKSKEQIKAEKIAAKEEKKRLEQEARDREKKKKIDYKKTRLNPDTDPGVYLKVGQQIDPLKKAWNFYESQWKDIDSPDAPLDVIRGYMMELITETAYHDCHIQLRPIVDEMMRLELSLLKNALKNDYLVAGLKTLPLVKKRKKPKKPKPPKPSKVSPEKMFQKLTDEGIVIKYPKLTLDDFWGDRNYAAADMRAILWTPRFPPPCLGDVREQVRIRCLLTLGCKCPNAQRTQLLVGPKYAGKRSLVYAVATETNAILMDLSPMNVYNKFPGPKNLKMMFDYVNKIARIMQPTVILIDNADKMFYKKVPKPEKIFDPTRLSKDIYKELIRPLGANDNILVIGTASEPWLAKGPAMFKIFPSTIMIPKTDYGSLSFILTQTLMQYHGLDREFNVHSVAQTLRGYDINTIRKAIKKMMTGKRQAQLCYKPLDPMEILSVILEDEEAVVTEDFENQMFQDWYLSYSPWGEKSMDYMMMLDSQLTIKLKNEKKMK